jgi:alpha-D-ribose 1-methylphosphonate 5-triphosphate synthase subunit PhnH
MTVLEAMQGGFADPVFDSQAVFRTLMQAMSSPGTCQPLHASVRAPVPLGATAAAAALTLCDHDTQLWLDPNLSTAPGALAWLAFHTGAPVTSTPADAHFAVVSCPGELIALENFAQGSQEYPDRSTTLILQLARLGPSGPLGLEGPGIRLRQRLEASPLPRHFGRNGCKTGDGSRAGSI